MVCGTLLAHAYNAYGAYSAYRVSFIQQNSCVQLQSMQCTIVIAETIFQHSSSTPVCLAFII